MSCMVIRCAGWTVVGIDPTVRSSRYWCSLALVPLAVVVYAGYKICLQTHPAMSTSLNFNLLFFSNPAGVPESFKNDHFIMFEHQIHPIGYQDKSPQSSVYHILPSKIPAAVLGRSI